MLECAPAYRPLIVVVERAVEPRLSIDHLLEEHVNEDLHLFEGEQLCHQEVDQLVTKNPLTLSLNLTVLHILAPKVEQSALRNQLVTDYSKVTEEVLVIF